MVLALMLINSCNPSHPSVKESKNSLEVPKHASMLSEKHKVSWVGDAQGTYYAISYYDLQERNLKPQIDSLLRAYDQSASNYKESSIISKVNNNIPVELDDIFIGNFELAMEVSRKTKGAFDITVRPLVELWGFGKKAPSEVSDAQIDSVLDFVGYRKVRIENGKIIKDDHRLQLDFNAIAQGYAVDVLGDYLSSLGIENYLVDIGGEVRAQGQKPGGESWRVGVERPSDNAAYGENLSAVIRLNDMALATSGNYRKFYEKDGIKYSHTIHPKMGRSVQSRLLSATILSKRAALSDAMATACMVMGLEESMSYLRQDKDLEALLIYSDENGEYQLFMTEGMKSIVEEQN